MKDVLTARENTMPQSKEFYCTTPGMSMAWSSQSWTPGKRQREKPTFKIDTWCLKSLGVICSFIFKSLKSPLQIVLHFTPKTSTIQSFQSSQQKRSNFRKIAEMVRGHGAISLVDIQIPLLYDYLAFGMFLT